MDKVIVVKFELEGYLHLGFNVTVQMQIDKDVTFAEFKGKLPANPSIYQQYKIWQESFNTKRMKSRGGGKTKYKTRKKNANDRNFELDFIQNFNIWLNSQDKEWQKIIDGLHCQLRWSDEIQVIIQTDNLEAQRLPWHLWDWFARYAPKTEVAISATKNVSNPELAIGLQEFKASQMLSWVAKNAVNILIVRGNSAGLDVNPDYEAIKRITGVNPEIFDAKKEELILESLQQKLRSHPWDILVFSGHSYTDEKTGVGYLQLTENLNVPLDDLRDDLKEAIAHGLKLAIFNSCDGLGLAREMATLQMPQVIVMRETLPDEVAPDFLDHFLKAYTNHKSFYKSVSIARKELQKKWQEKYPGIAWLPLINQNPAHLPISWYELQPDLSEQKRRRPENESILLNKVKTYWVEGVLEKSLHSSLWVELGLEERWDAIADHQNIVQEIPEQLPPGTRVIDVWNEMETAKRLLILGNSASGKTTTLIELAAELITNAEQDNKLSIPIIFNLSTWKGEKQTLNEWLLQELNEKYHVSKTLGQQWINSQKLMLILDGLDEVRSNYADSCIQTINQFIQQHQITEVVVSSSVEYYKALKSHLQFQRAIYVQPLTAEQIDYFFTKAEAGFTFLAGLRSAFKNDVVLQELAKSPLTLNMMILVYATFSEQEISRMSETDRYRDLFKRYIQLMLSQRNPNIGYTNRHKYKQYYPDILIQKWLSWLAKKMHQRSQTIFLIERMQPNWLNSKKTRLLYSLVFSLSFSSIGGLLIGMIVWLTLGVLFEGYWGLVLAAILALLFATISAIWAALTIGKVSREIEPVETLNWSIKNLSKSLIGGMIAGLVTWKLTGMNVFLIVGLLISIIFGIQGPNLEKTTFPNQGIWQSIKNTILFSIIGAVGLGIPAAFQTKGLLSIITNSSSLQNQISNVNLIIAGMIAGLFFGLTQAGVACLQHINLRIVAYITRCSPWNYTAFLDYATERIFLQKVGGGYIFIHRLLRDHFANLNSN
ncbi:NACHT nucleoside triphosphatase [Anabaena sp. 90]|uniref:CHAT domain-containing protein n=1 Tax=Anabaena sp. 90 TaxID=46234 RepID=UPI00029B6A22|nr:CHAT domain-containing protein [Anabaena sp. 90]AFW96125.1 NACHT nucleoside triphosphatase [Anabaena sp. 90]